MRPTCVVVDWGFEWPSLTMASPAIRVSQYEESTAKKDQDDDDDLDRELESYIKESDKRKEEEETTTVSDNARKFIMSW